METMNQNVCNHDAKPVICFGHEFKMHSCPEPECTAHFITMRGLRQHRIHRKTWVREENHR